jgi:hypothetical protein
VERMLRLSALLERTIRIKKGERMRIGYDKQLYILPFDHRHSCRGHGFGVLHADLAPGAAATGITPATLAAPQMCCA